MRDADFIQNLSEKATITLDKLKTLMDFSNDKHAVNYLDHTLRNLLRYEDKMVRLEILSDELILINKEQNTPQGTLKFGELISLIDQREKFVMKNNDVFFKNEDNAHPSIQNNSVNYPSNMNA